MAAQQNPAQDNARAVPVACALTPADLAAQAARWLRLTARAMTARAETPRGLRIRFRAEPRVEAELRSLAATENQCCPWASWTVEPNAGWIVLDVTSAGEGVAALHSMFTG